MDFIAALETAMGTVAEKIMMPAQPGEVLTTWADTTLLRTLTGFTPSTDHRDGVQAFVDWWQTARLRPSHHPDQSNTT